MATSGSGLRTGISNTRWYGEILDWLQQNSENNAFSREFLEGRFSKDSVPELTTARGSNLEGLPKGQSRK